MLILVLVFAASHIIRGSWAFGPDGCRHLNLTLDPLGRLKCAGFQPERILDIGAHYGHWTRNAIRLFPHAHAMMLDGGNYHDKWKYVVQHGNVVGAQVLLDSHEHETEWHTSDMFTTGNSLFKERTGFFSEGSEAQRMRTQTLDGFFRRAGYTPKFDLIKIDVQGAELAILAGGREVLKHAEFVIMELQFAGEYNSGAPSFAEYVSFMDRAGFVPFDLAEVNRQWGLVISIDLTWTRRGSKWDALARDLVTRMI